MAALHRVGFDRVLNFYCTFTLWKGIEGKTQTSNPLVVLGVV